MHLFRHHILLIPALILTINLSSCISNTLLPPSVEKLIMEAYTPNIDIYLFRGDKGFSIPGGANPISYIVQLFDYDKQNSIHKFQLQVDMVFYTSTIRFFLLSAKGLENTFRDTVIIDPSDSETMSMDKCNTRIQAELFPCPSKDNSNKRCYFGDLFLGGLNIKPDDPFAEYAKPFFLSNYEGTRTKATSFRIGEHDPVFRNVRMFFADRVSFCDGVAGISSLGIPDTLDKLRYRAQSSLAVASKHLLNPNLSANRIRSSIIGTIAHELGHFFGLVHSFEPESCQFEKGERSTNRIMDYSRNPSVFTDCEKGIYLQGSKAFLNGVKQKYEIHDNGTPVKIRNRVHPPTFSAFLHSTLDDQSKEMLHDGRIQIFDDTADIKSIGNGPIVHLSEDILDSAQTVH